MEVRWERGSQLLVEGGVKVIERFKALEYLRTCNIFYLINGPRVTFGIFD